MIDIMTLPRQIFLGAADAPKADAVVPRKGSMQRQQAALALVVHEPHHGAAEDPMSGRAARLS